MGPGFANIVHLLFDGALQSHRVFTSLWRKENTMFAL